MAKVTALFSKSKLPFGRLISWGLREEISHCGFKLYFDNGETAIVHAAFGGLQFTTLEEFKKGRIILWEIGTGLSMDNLLIDCSRHSGATYDYGAFLYWTLRVLLNKLGFPKPTKNLWGSSKAFLCSEYLGRLLWGIKDNVLLTPAEAASGLMSLGYSVLYSYKDAHGSKRVQHDS